VSRRPIEPPEMPPATEEELAHARDISAKLRALAAELHQRNLNNVVLLAQQAAAGRGPLVEHFAELGQRHASGTPATRERHGGVSHMHQCTRGAVGTASSQVTAR
jgi:hypothetical protein